MTNKEADNLRELDDANAARAQAWEDAKTDPNISLPGGGFDAAAQRVKAAEAAHQGDLDEWRQDR